VDIYWAPCLEVDATKQYGFKSG